MHLLVVQVEGMAAAAGVGGGQRRACVPIHEGRGGVLPARGVPPQLQLVVLAAPRV